MKKILLALLLLGSSVSRADDKDLHLAVSFGISAATYAIMRDNGADKTESALTAAYLTVLVGVAKEIYDNSRPNNEMDPNDIKYGAIGGILAPAIILRF